MHNDVYNLEFLIYITFTMRIFVTTIQSRHVYNVHESIS